VQILIERLRHPWGIQQQVGYIARWLNVNNRSINIYTRELNTDYYGDIRPVVNVTDRPWSRLEKDVVTLIGPYPATYWVQKSRVESYSILLSDLPWGLYPNAQKEWLGTLPTYVSGNRRLIAKSIQYVVKAPWRSMKRFYFRRQPQSN